MKKTLIVLAVSAVFAVTGCTSTPEPAPTVTVTETVKPTPTPTPTLTKAVSDELFLNLVRKAHPVLGGIKDATLIETAATACRALDRGATKEEIIQVVVESTMSRSLKEGMVFTMGAGVQLYCPEHSSTFR